VFGILVYSFHKRLTHVFYYYSVTSGMTGDCVTEKLFKLFYFLSNESVIKWSKTVYVTTHQHWVHVQIKTYGIRLKQITHYWYFSTFNWLLNVHYKVLYY